MAQHKRNLKEAVREHERYIKSSESYTAMLKRQLKKYQNKLKRLEKDGDE